MIWFFCLIIAVVFSLINIIFSKKPRTAGSIVEIFLLYLLVFQVGLMCLIAFYEHVFNGAAIAAKIGWSAGSPFQYEVGMMNLGEGVLGVLCIWFRKNFWLATAIIASITMAGCGVGHLREIVLNNNLAPYNAGIGIWLEATFLPAALLILAFLNRKLNG